MKHFYVKCVYIVILQFVLVAVGLANTLTLSEEGEVLAETDRYQVRFEHGVLVHFHNKLTNETYTLPPQDDSNEQSGISIQHEEGHYGREETLNEHWDIETQRLSSLAIEIAYHSDYRTDKTVRMRIMIDSETQDLVIHQTGTSAFGGIVRVMWGCGYLNSQQVNIILPANGGQIINNATEFSRRGFAYPEGWEAQLAILQGEDGGFFVRSTDTTYQFKGVWYTRSGEHFDMRFQTDNFAPFRDKHEITSAPWRLNAYRGDWQVPARIYRDWMENAFQPNQPPAWVKDIELVLNSPGIDKETLQLLAEHVNPSTTLIHLINWLPWQGINLDKVDTDLEENYPEYTPKPEFDAFLEAAHAYGFRVQPHVHFNGVSPNHPLYPAFEKYQFRDPIRGWKLGWNWDNPATKYRLAYINPASKEFREYLVGQLKKVYETYPIDAWHLDINHLVVNNPPIDGLTPAEGNVLLHQELSEAMPGVVFGGEHLHEVTFPHVNLALRWNIPEDEQPHPISSFLFSPWTISYGHTSVPNPDLEPERYQAFEAAYQVWDVLPALRIRGPWILDPSMTLTHRKLENVDTGYFWDIFFVGDVYSQGDVNADGVVNVLDLVMVAQHIGGEKPNNPRVDVNGDGVVNILDLTLVAQHIG